MTVENELEVSLLISRRELDDRVILVNEKLEGSKPKGNQNGMDH